MAFILDACAAQHIGDRKEQQDQLGLFANPRLKGTVVAIVADGMGGHTGGRLAAEQVVLSVKSNFERYAPREETPQSVLTESLLEAHRMIRTGRFLNEQDPHSTGVAAILEPVGERWRITWAWCGDTRFYHFRNGQLVTRTRDHSYVEELLRLKRISEDDAKHHPKRNVLITSLGGAEAPRIDTAQSDDVQAGDAFLLCSDGLWGDLSDDEIGERLLSLKARPGTAELIQLARSRADGKGDNTSLVVLRIVSQ